MDSPTNPRDPWSLLFVFQDYHLDCPNDHPLPLAVANALVGGSVDRNRLEALARDCGIGDLEEAKANLLDQRDQLRSAVANLLPRFHLQQLVDKHDIEPYLPNRIITQRVKDMVWRRDGGRCVTCGSRENLEFDHIIPFSKGGASTYRNVQLLCQQCNRRKSDAIGRLAQP